MADPEELPDGRKGWPFGTITITTIVAEDGELIHNVEAVDADGDDLGLMESLGMIEMAKDSLLRVPPGTEIEGEDHAG
jgi:hypothetical protein